MKNVVE